MIKIHMMNYIIFLASFIFNISYEKLDEFVNKAIKPPNIML